MGQEVEMQRLRAADFDWFAACLEKETALLKRAWRTGEFDQATFRAGFELEGWLVDRNAYPVADNQRFLDRVASPLVVPELSKFNIELNGTPRRLGALALRRLEAELDETWHRCVSAAHELESTVVAIGILPTLRNADLCLANLSPLNRYRLLNDEILRQRAGRPIRVSIDGGERLDVAHHDVMLEAATTSFQVHFQVPAEHFERAFNASLILSATSVALAANAPFLFGKDLWSETRIPLFEQAVDSGAVTEPAWHRVTFGSGYLGAGEALRIFDENVARYRPLLPIRMDSPAAEFRHLRLHNGTIWRWNRPLLGFDETGLPHLRIEHRVMAAGPTNLDMIANAALYLGATQFLAAMERPPESDLSFEAARFNFYEAARHGFDARIVWLDGRKHPISEVLLREVIPMAREGLVWLGVGEDERDRYLDIIAARVRTGQNGAVWQRRHVARYGRDWHHLLAEYLEHQRSGAPVHEWPI